MLLPIPVIEAKVSLITLMQDFWVFRVLKKLFRNGPDFWRRSCRTTSSCLRVTKPYRKVVFSSPAIVESPHYDSELSGNLNDVAALKHIVRLINNGRR